MDKKNILERAVKTFVEAFISTILTEVCAVLSSSNFNDVGLSWKLFMPVIVSALAAALSAAWNYILEKTKENEFEDLSGGSGDK